MGTIAAAIDLLANLAQATSSISALVQKATAEGRTELTADEWKTITDTADTAHTHLEAVLNA
jgi:adenine/guanine phosphoribosyltransferase-like PRPP-binding protein